MNGRRPIPADTLVRQRIASDPKRSAWVGANAGSGKTHVLTQRVLRLLLEGAQPSRILCLTYTKAAAANMAARVYDALAKWTALDDEALARAIGETGAPAPTQATLAFARRLFARVVETPGGLKIQTIHAFCEKVLHLFPFEANAPAGFRVMDDLERAEILDRARARALAHAVREMGESHDALTRVAQETSGAGFDALVRELLDRRETLRNGPDRAHHARELRRRLGLADNASLASVQAEIVDGGLAPCSWNSIATRLRQGSKNDKTLAASLARAAALAPHEDCVEDYFDVFFTKKREPRASAITGGLAKKDPELLALIEAERERLYPLIGKRQGALLHERSIALSLVGAAIVDEYRQAKALRGLFDFDDLIERTHELLRRSSASWVLYKLDSRIDHVLLDEAQDTSAAQWDILAALVDEFCSGVGARGAGRTFFAVGDEKQSIFSFQGAAPERFDAMRRAFERRFAAARKPFETVALTRSFRSSPAILKAVDDVFASQDNARGLSADHAEPPPVHETVKTDLPGLVEIWDLVGPQGRGAPADWRLPLDYRDETDPAVRLAQKIARKIGALIADGDSVEENGERRPVEPGDILILVRKRDAFFEAIIRALKAKHIPVAGADRLRLGDHIAVMDLVALGRAALLPQDDLTLATLVKSPLVGLSDDDLISVAPQRAGALCEALAASADLAHRAAARQIEQWRRDAAALSPFDFYSRVLAAGGGRKKLVARLGAEAHDALDEFLRLALAYERDEAPSLAGFLAGVEALDISVKRDMEAAGGAVRVMTTHAAKGLEEKIVFLPDTCGAPAGRHDPKLFALGAEGEEPALAWTTNKDADPPAVAKAREVAREAERAEHRRLLYVALTRAEERLYVCGYHGERGPAEGCWYLTIRDALEPTCDARSDPDDAERMVLSRGEIVRLLAPARPVRSGGEFAVPDFVRRPAPREAPPTPPLRPSSALAAADAAPSFAGGLAPTRGNGERLLAGRLTHALLQYLPGCAPKRRLEAARAFLELRGGELDAARRESLARAAIGVIEAPAFAPLFGPDSAPEVDVIARLATPRGELAISGRVDRLAVAADEVFVADFKAGRRPANIGDEHLRQLALYRAAVAPLYPEKRVRCALIFTQDALALEAEDAALDDALRWVVDEM
jgi:ATP-dependent helicase/nuclease subunit A